MRFSEQCSRDHVEEPQHDREEANGAADFVGPPGTADFGAAGAAAASQRERWFSATTAVA